MKLHPLFLLPVWIGGIMCFTQPIQFAHYEGPETGSTPTDARAVLIADQIQQAAGGRKAWENTRFVAWNFMKIRKIVWDKQVGNVRIDNLYKDQTVLLNLNNSHGIVAQNGEEVFQPDSVVKYVKQGINDWRSDSYWLFMPFKLKDNGVSLQYVGEETVSEGKETYVLQVIFPPTLNTPTTKYKIWVDKRSHLITHYATYQKHTDKQPMHTFSLSDYQQFGTLLLPGKRGIREITDIMVFSGLPGEVFRDFEKTDLSRYPQVRFSP